MTLRDYEQGKFAIADILRRAANLVGADDEVARTTIRDLFTRLAEDRFNIVIVGRFSRGKTSVVNALLAVDRLPVGIVPLTSVVTTVSYGTVDQVFLTFQESRLRSEIPLSALAQHITQAGNPGNTRGIRIADVRLRAELLRRGFFLVDTPGIGSAIAANTQTTEAFLPEADAFLLITSYDAALTEEEVALLRREISSSRRIFVVVNKHDTVSTEQRDLVLRYVRDQLQSICDGADIPLFSVSATEALEAHQTNNPDLLSRCGIRTLRDELVSFVLVEKHKQVIQQMSGRVAQFIKTLPTTPQLISLASEAEKLAASFQGVKGLTPFGATAPTVANADTSRVAELRSCEICREVNDALWNFECQFQYDICAEPAAKQQFATADGLCSFHTWEYQTTTSAYGVCNAYPPLLDHLAQKLRSTAEGSCDTRSDDPILAPKCALCAVRDAAEAKCISRLSRRFADEGERVLDTLSAICIPHLQKLLPALERSDHIRHLLLRQAGLLQRVSEDMHRFALKSDASRRGLESKEEAGAAERGLLLVAGHRGALADAANPDIGMPPPDTKSWSPR